MTIKLSKHLCLECSTCAMFFSSSFTVSIITIFLSRILSCTLIIAPFMLLFSLVIMLYSINKKSFKEVLTNVALDAGQLPMYEIYITLSESFGYILMPTIQKKGKSTYYTKYFSIFVLNVITRYQHIEITIIKQSIKLS